MSEQRSSRRRNRVTANVRRGVLVGALIALLVANAYVVRQQFPPREREMNENYDAGLRALTDRQPGQDPPAAAIAVRHFERYLQLDEESERVWFLLGVARQELGQADAAAEAFRRAVDLDPELDRARVGLAELALASQDYATALVELERARKFDPTPSSVWIVEAQLRLQLGDHEGAVKAYDAAVQSDPSSYASYLALGDLLMARAAVRGSVAEREAAASRYREAETICRTRLESAEDKVLRMSLAKAIAGQARVQQERSLDEAVAELRKVIAAYPDDPEPALVLGEFFRRLGRMDEARRQLEAAGERWKTRAVDIALHELYLALGEVGDAEKSLRTAVARDPEDEALRIKLTGFLVGQERYDEALAEAQSAVDLFGADRFEVHEALGDLWRARSTSSALAGEQSQAAAHATASLAAYERALALRPRSLRLKKKVAGQILNELLLATDDEDRTEREARAREFIGDVLAVNGRDPEALAWQARVLVAEERFDEVATLLAELAGKLDAPIEALRVLGLARERLGDARGAAEMYVRVIEQLTGTAYETRKRDELALVSDWLSAIRSTARAGRIEDALAFAERGVTAWPSSGQLHAERCRSLLITNQTDRAIRELVAAQVQFPQLAVLRYLLAAAYETNGKPQLAEEVLQAALADLPGDQDTTRRLYFELLARTGRSEQAEEGLLQLISASPNDPESHVRLGDFYMRLQPRRMDAARVQYERAAELAPRSPDAWLRLAELDFAEAATSAQAFVAAEETVRRFVERLPESAFVPYLRGKLALAAGRNEEAVELLDAFVVRAPRDPAGPYYRSRALRALGRLPEALQAMEQAFRVSGGRQDMATQLAALRYEAGMQAFDTGDFELARRLLAQAEAGGASQGSKLFLAGAHANAGQFDLSEAACRELLSDDPDNQVGMHLLAAVLIRKGTDEALAEAEQLFRSALRKDDTDLLASVGIASVQFLRGAYTEALTSFRQVYPRTNAEPSVAMGVAQCMAILGDAVGAAEFLDGEIKTHPERVILLHIKADFLVHLELFDDAAETFLRAFELDRTDVTALLAAAAAYTQRRDPDSARKILVANLDVPRDGHKVHLALADILLALGRVDEAADEMRKSLALMPTYPRSLLMLGKVAEYRGKLDEARNLYREAVAARSPDPEPFVRLAQIFDQEGNSVLAIETYRQALERAPRNALVRNNLALLLAEEEGGLEEAVEMARIAQALRSEDPRFADTYGWLLFRSGSTARAAELLERAAGKLGQDAEVAYHAGMALARLKRRLDAQVLLERAIRLAPEAEWVETARRELESLR